LLAGHQREQIHDYSESQQKPTSTEKHDECDETASNRFDALYEVTDKVFMEPTLPTDEYLSKDGRVMEVLSEHMCQGWLEGYLLTGRHGFFSCYEAFIHIVDSMFNQHAKWLKVTRHIPWRRPIASLNYLLTSHVWPQDHNGFTHQDPGFIYHQVVAICSLFSEALLPFLFSFSSSPFPPAEQNLARLIDFPSELKT
jgi:phosphoketolase